jgi:hypothetical protein
MGWGPLVDLALSEEEQTDLRMPRGVQAKADVPKYPYGTRLSLTEAEMSKLGLGSDCDVDDKVVLRCVGTITSVSPNKRADGTNDARVEIQIEHMAVREDDDDDD